MCRKLCLKGQWLIKLSYLSAAGGSSAEVALCDLRMTDGVSSKIVQKYCPRNLSLVDMISVSGLDVSKDGKELLVSYESDQIYTFPIFPRSSCAAGPTVDEMTQLSDGLQNDVLHELACYGGHLNRFTFLKVCGIPNGNCNLCMQYSILLHVNLSSTFPRMRNMLAHVMNTFAQGQTLDEPGSTTRLMVPLFLY